MEKETASAKALRQKHIWYVSLGVRGKHSRSRAQRGRAGQRQGGPQGCLALTSSELVDH